MSEYSSQTNKSTAAKYAIYVLATTGVAYIVYKTYQRRNKDIEKSYSITESVATSWKDHDTPKPSSISNMNPIHSMELFPKKKSMKFYSPQPHFQKYGNKITNQQISLSPQISINSNPPYYNADYGKELTPILQHRPFQRQASIPKLDLSATFLGESSYRETVIFLLALAVNRLFPNQQLIICNTFKFGTSR
eukprot:858341_1